MPLHLLGKKSWNVYNADNIARVKADEAAAAAREEAADQRKQEADAARRAAILRGQTPPPIVDDESLPAHHGEAADRKGGNDRKRRRLAGEDDTDRDIRLAASSTTEGHDARLVKLRKPSSDAPLTDHAGNINLFPVDHREQLKREKNDEAEKEKRAKERALQDQYTMRFSNAAGSGGLDQEPWYASGGTNTSGPDRHDVSTVVFPHLENKNVWGNEDPRRQGREQLRIASNDPFAFMQKAQVQLRKSKEDRKKWAEERSRELAELRPPKGRCSPGEKSGKRKKHAEDNHRTDGQDDHLEDLKHSSAHRHRHRHRHASSDRGREQEYLHASTQRHRDRKKSRSRERDKGRSTHIREHTRSNRDSH